jgi:LytS/YehU family sensor histidine kinase
MSRTKTLTFIALMAALSVILSLPPFVIPITIGTFPSEVHFTQIPILLSGILAGPWAGLVTGAIGGLYMSWSVEIPFIVGGLALLGLAAGFFAKKLKLRPLFTGILAWGVQSPYVFVTDYTWFIFSRGMPSPAALAVVTTILVKLTIEALIASALSAIVIPYIKRPGIFTSEKINET